MSEEKNLVTKFRERKGNERYITLMVVLQALKERCLENLESHGMTDDEATLALFEDMTPDDVSFVFDVLLWHKTQEFMVFCYNLTTNEMNIRKGLEKTKHIMRGHFLTIISDMIEELDS